MNSDQVLNSNPNELLEKWLRKEGYTLGQRIGKGSFSTVHKAYFKDPKYKNCSVHQLACKIIDKRDASSKPKFIKRELAILPKIDHSQIIKIYSIIECTTNVYIFMEYATESDLGNYILENGAVNENQARIWFGQLCDAIKYLHAMNIVHRDLKLDNILLTKKMQLKITDFGFAKYCVRSNCNRSVVCVLSETYCGTASYSSPELLQRKPYNMRKADVWSLGVILFTLVNGNTPFDETSLGRLIYDQLHGNFHFNEPLWSLLTENCKHLLLNILEYDASKRISSLDSILKSEWLNELIE